MDINYNYNMNKSYPTYSVNAFNEVKSKMNEAVQKVASCESDLKEQVLKNKEYVQQLQSMSKVVETERKNVGTLIDIFV